MTLTPGARLGPYEVLGPLGAGGMGEVYRARDTSLSRDVAIKVLLAEVAAGSRAAGPLQARGSTALRPISPTSPPSMASAGKPFLVLELVEGEDLAQRLKRGPIPIDEALPIAKQVAEALEEAHEHGIVHRDLKPASIKLTPPDISQSPRLARGGTDLRVILGTPACMSPEQARGKPADRRTDICAFGVVLFEMLTGKRTVPR